MPKVSIIVPIYNVEQYLRQAMDSLINQEEKDLEFVCINDGSTDNSLKILKEYHKKDKRIVIIDKENGGYGLAMNIGISKAKGKYIGILEPDDFVPSNMFKDLYEIASKNDLDFVKADFYRFETNPDGSIEKLLYQLSDDPKDYNIIFNPSETPNALRYVMNTWSGIYKKKFLKDNNILHNTTPGASYQDNGFWMQTFVFAKKAMIIDKPYYMNRRDNPNSSVYNPLKVYTMNIEYDYIKDILIKHPLLWERFKAMYYYKKYYSYETSLNRIALEFKKEYTYRFSKEFKRAYQKKELIKDVFSHKAWEDITLLINDPNAFYNEYIRTKGDINSLKRRVEELEIELDAIKNSRSYKIGRLLTLIPRKIRGLFRRIKKIINKVGGNYEEN